MEGTIRKIDRERGFSFIHSQDGRDVLFHRTNVNELGFERLKEGLNVEFEVRSNRNEPRAVNVRLSWTEKKLLG